MESVKPVSGMPTISSFVLPQSEKEGVKESVAGSVSHTEVAVQSISHNISGDNPAKDGRVHPSADLSGREATKDGESVSAIQKCKKPLVGVLCVNTELCFNYSFYMHSFTINPDSCHEMFAVDC